MKKVFKSLYLISSFSLIFSSCSNNESSSISSEESSSVIVSSSEKKENTITINDNDGSGTVRSIKVIEGEEYQIAFPQNLNVNDHTFLGYQYNNAYFPSFGIWDPTLGDITINGTYGKSKNIEFSFTSSIDNSKELDFSFLYNPMAFISHFSSFNNDLAYLSLMEAIHSVDETEIKELYDELGFYNVLTYNYDKNEADNVAFTIGEKVVIDKTIISLSIRSGNYGLEWSNNFKMGATGDHLGFKESAEKIITSLSSYLVDHSLSYENIYLFVNGYSRGAGIANILGYKLVKDNYIDNAHINVYDWEAPAPIDNFSLVAVDNIYNLYNSSDIVTAIPPLEYGLARAGEDINIYSDNVEELIKQEFNLTLPELGATYNTDQEVLNYVIEQLLVVDLESEYHDISTRYNFASYYQDSIRHTLEIFGALDDNMIKVISNKYDRLSEGDKSALLEEDDKLYLFLSPILDNFSIEYDKLTLKNNLNNILHLSKTSGVANLKLFITIGSINLSRMIDMHLLEVNYVLFKNYIGE